MRDVSGDVSQERQYKFIKSLLLTQSKPLICYSLLFVVESGRLLLDRAAHFSSFHLHLKIRRVLLGV